MKNVMIEMENVKMIQTIMMGTIVMMMEIVSVKMEIEIRMILKMIQTVTMGTLVMEIVTIEILTIEMEIEIIMREMEIVIVTREIDEIVTREM
jgi:hypothetical protein